MGRATEEIKVLITGDASKLNRELTSAEKAVLRAKGIVQSAGGAVSGSSKAWTKYRTSAVSEMNKAMEGVRKAQEKVRAIREQVQATTMSDNDLEPYIQAMLKQGRSDESIQSMVDEMQRPSPALQQKYDEAKAALAAYQKAADEAAQSVQWLNQKVSESAQAEQAQLEAARSATARAKEQARTARESAKAHRESETSSRASGSGLLRFSRTAGFAMLGVASLYAGLRRLITTMLETAKADASLSSSLGQIKGNLGVAFQAVYQAALPALRALASMLATATSYLAQFLSMLFGISWASASKGAQDYAASVGGAGAAAKAAAQNMMSIDELNVMNAQGGGGGGGGGIEAIYQEREMPEWLKKLVDWLKPVTTAVSELAGSIKEFIDGVIETVKQSPAMDALAQGLTDIRDALSDVILFLSDLFKDKTFQSLVGGIISIALYTVGTALSIVAKGIQLVLSLLKGDGKGALQNFVGILIEAGRWVKSILITLEYGFNAIFQGIALGVNLLYASFNDTILKWLGFGDEAGQMAHEAVASIQAAIEQNGVKYELELALNESSADAALAEVDRWFGGAGDSANSAKTEIEAFDKELQAAKGSTEELTRSATDSIEASSSAIAQALQETPTVEAAQQLGSDLMKGFSAGISENASMVMDEMTASISAGGTSIIAEAKKITEEAKAKVLTITNDMIRRIEQAFSDMFDQIHFDLAYLLGAIVIDIAFMVTGINLALSKIKTQLSFKINVEYTSSGAPSLPLPSILKMARGGIIHAAAGGGGFTTGQLFVAREAGPELVANLGGGKSSVMNNDQIVESVSSGVYRAVVEAMSAMQSGDSGDFVVNVDGRELLRVTRKAERASGYRLSGNPSFAR